MENLKDTIMEKLKQLKTIIIERPKDVLKLLAVIAVFLFILYSSSGKWMVRSLLKEKYGEKFTVLNVPNPAAIFSLGLYSAFCAPEEHPEAVFEIYVGSFRKKIFVDDYPESRIAAELAGQLEERLRECFGECHVQGILLDGYYEELNQVMTADEYLSGLETPIFSSIIYSVAVDTSDYDVKSYSTEYDFLVDAIKEMDTGIETTLYISFASGSDYKSSVKSMSTSYFIETNRRSYTFYYSPETQAYEVWTNRDAVTEPKKLTKEMYIKTRKKEK